MRHTVAQGCLRGGVPGDKSQEIIDGRHDELPEQAFYMVGTIDEAVEKGQKLKG